MVQDLEANKANSNNANTTVLVVDDSDSIRLFVKKVMEREGISCLEAESGEKAIELTSQRPVHLVFMDMQMPGLSGLETLEKLRTIHGNKFPIVAFSANAKSRLEEGKEAFDGFIQKPVDRHELVLKTWQFIQNATL